MSKKAATQLKSFSGLSWEATMEKLEQEAHILLLSTKDDDTWQVVSTLKLYGAEAATAAVVAYLFMYKHGPSATADEGIKTYTELVPHAERGPLFNEMLYWTGWLRNTGPQKKSRKWPVQPPSWEDDSHRRFGLANVMLAISVPELANGGQNTELIAAHGIQRFLDDGLNRKRKNSENSLISSHS